MVEIFFNQKWRKFGTKRGDQNFLFNYIFLSKILFEKFEMLVKNQKKPKFKPKI